MSRIQVIQSQLQDTEAALAQLDRAIALEPSPALESEGQSLRKRQRELEAQFLDAAKSLGRKVCSYRLFKDDQQPKLAGLASALGDFQATFSVTFNALKSGRKDMARVPADVAQSSAFEFAYAFTGSVGIVLTMSDEQLLFGDTVFDRTIQTIAEVAHADTPGAVAAHAKRLGSAPIRVLYKWARAHSQSDMGAEIEWLGENVRERLLIQAPQFRKLAATIEATSDETVEELELVGEVVGADIPGKRFHMRFPEGPEIFGTFEDAIGEQHEVTLPRRYRASLRKTTKTQYSLDKDEVNWFLIRINEP